MAAVVQYMKLKKERLRYITKSKIKGFSKYLIPFELVVIFTALCGKENGYILLISTIFFFIYFYSINSFIQDYTKKSRDKLEEIGLFILLLLSLVLPLFLIYGEQKVTDNNKFQNTANVLFISILVIHTLLIQDWRQKISPLIAKLSLFILLIMGLFYFFNVFPLQLHFYQLTIYGIMTFSYLGISLVYFVINVLFNYVKRKTNNFWTYQNH